VASESRLYRRMESIPSERLAERLDALLDEVEQLPMERPVDEHYADIRAVLERAGTPIGPNDLLIAAHARALDLVLVTDNEREFSRVPVSLWRTGCVHESRGAPITIGNDLSEGARDADALDHPDRRAHATRMIVWSRCGRHLSRARCAHAAHRQSTTSLASPESPSPAALTRPSRGRGRRERSVGRTRPRSGR